MHVHVWIQVVVMLMFFLWELYFFPPRFNGNWDYVLVSNTRLNAGLFSIVRIFDTFQFSALFETIFFWPFSGFWIRTIRLIFFSNFNFWINAFALKCTGKRLLWEKISTFNKMKLIVPQKKLNDGKMYTVVMLVIVNCNFSLLQGESRRLCRKQNGSISIPNFYMYHHYMYHQAGVCRLWAKLTVTSKKAIVSTTTYWGN